MFGVLNRFIARLDSEPVPQSSSTGPGDSSYGFQVLRNTNTDLPIEPWFDFLVGINHHLIVSQSMSLFIRPSRSSNDIRMIQIHSFLQGKSAIALDLSSPLISGVPRYGDWSPVFRVVSKVDPGPADTHNLHCCTL